jgi:hypothetical protein
MPSKKPKRSHIVLFHLRKISRTSEDTETANRLWVPETGGGLMLNGDGIYFPDDKLDCEHTTCP